MSKISAKELREQAKSLGVSVEMLIDWHSIMTTIFQSLQGLGLKPKKGTCEISVSGLTIRTIFLNGKYLQILVIEGDQEIFSMYWFGDMLAITNVVLNFIVLRLVGPPTAGKIENKPEKNDDF